MLVEDVRQGVECSTLAEVKRLERKDNKKQGPERIVEDE
jgi:hypothetical protein